MITNKEQMNIVVVGHVDHGKSTVIGRLMADTGSLPKGKLEQIKEMCAINSRPFEYAFLLDALKDEQSQGITIDAARCFFKTSKRHYIIIDAPGHIEFLKNMVTGASRAEAALLVIDAGEGVRENSRRHGFMVSLLGIKQIVVLVNKMDLAGYSKDVFEKIKNEFSDFLNRINVTPLAYVPVSAREGEGIVNSPSKMPWYKGETALAWIDRFEKEKPKEQQPFRFPVQDIYRFTEDGDNRRIIAGTIETGSVKVGDEVIFLPSGKKSNIKSIEGFNIPERKIISAGYAAGFTLDTQIYIRQGEIMCRSSESLPSVSNTFKANIFWVGKKPMIQGKKYKLKSASTRATVYLKKVINIIDASSLDTETNKQKIEKHDVAECILQTLKPFAFDLISKIEATGRFVIVDDYEITGGGIIIDSLDKSPSFLAEHVEQRKFSWLRSSIRPEDRALRYKQKPRVLIITGNNSELAENLARNLEEMLFNKGKSVYYLGISNILSGLSGDMKDITTDRDEHLRRIGELAHLFTDAGMILITSIPDLDLFEKDIIETLNSPYETVLINYGSKKFNERSSLYIDEDAPLEKSLDIILEYLRDKEVLLEYYI